MSYGPLNWKRHPPGQTEGRACSTSESSNAPGFPSTPSTTGPHLYAATFQESICKECTPLSLGTQLPPAFQFLVSTLDVDGKPTPYLNFPQVSPDILTSIQEISSHPVDVILFGDGLPHFNQQQYIPSISVNFHPLLTPQVLNGKHFLLWPPMDLPFQDTRLIFP